MIYLLNIDKMVRDNMYPDIKIEIPDYVQNVLTHLEASGFEAFVVGGCVRDSIMGKNPDDWDICTSAKPDDVKTVFDGICTYITTGEKHGTITVISNDVPIEITTYRSDGVYNDGRHPQNVTYVSSIVQDLSRRDFTINAIAYDKRSGIIDIFNGINDIKNGIIRCVGVPSERFSEDALRIMRALRFSAVLSFEIEKETSLAIHGCKKLLENISAERIFAELSKLLLAKSPSKILKKYIDVFGIFINLFCDNKYQMKYIDMIDMLPHKISSRLAACLYPLDLYDVKNVLKKLKVDRVTCDRVSIILENKNLKMPHDRVAAKYLLNKVGLSNAIDIIEFYKVLNIINDSNCLNLDNSIYLINEIVADNECYCLKDLKIKGFDIVKLGVAQGTQIGIILNELLIKVIEGEVNNNREDLIAKAIEILTNNR